MPRGASLLALTTAAVLAAFTPMLVRAGEASAARADGGSVVLHLRSALVAQEVVKDVAPLGRTSPGDVILMRDVLTNLLPQLGRPKGARVGTDQATMTIVADGRSRIVGSAAFADGVVRFRGVVSATTTSVRVVGGSGRYLGATGRVVVKDGSAAGVAVNVYELRLPKTLSA